MFVEAGGGEGGIRVEALPNKASSPKRGMVVLAFAIALCVLLKRLFRLGLTHRLATRLGLAVLVGLRGGRGLVLAVVVVDGSGGGLEAAARGTAASTEAGGGDADKPRGGWLYCASCLSRSSCKRRIFSASWAARDSSATLGLLRGAAFVVAVAAKVALALLLLLCVCLQCPHISQAVKIASFSKVHI